MILDLLEEGFGHKQIAARLACSRHTVKTHCTRLYRKLGAANACHAAALRRQARLAGA